MYFVIFFSVSELFLLMQLVFKTEGTVIFIILKLRLRNWPFHDGCPCTTKICKVGTQGLRPQVLLTVESPGLKNYLQLFHLHLSVKSLLVPKASSCSPEELNVSTMLQAHPNTCSLQAYVLQSMEPMVWRKLLIKVSSLKTFKL